MTKIAGFFVLGLRKGWRGGNGLFNEGFTLCLELFPLTKVINPVDRIASSIRMRFWV